MAFLANLHKFYRVSKKYTELIERNLKLITVICWPKSIKYKERYGFLNMNFEPEILAGFEFFRVSN